MRNAFARELTRLATTDPRIVLLSGDIGNRLFDEFKTRWPERFFNCGVAEANMMSVAAGMAMSGLKPVVYTIVPFVTTRCLEQIRVDVCYHNVPVVIVGVGGGLSYAELGATHHSCEDIAFMRMLPHMNVVCPGDAVETTHALGQALDANRPIYIRIGKKGEPVVHQQTPEFEIGRGIVVRNVGDVALVSTGNLLSTAVDVAQRLQADGIAAGVVSMHTVKPLDCALLAELFAACRLVVTLEEHGLNGGLGSTVAEWFCDARSTAESARYLTECAQLLRIGTPDHFTHEAGDQEHARRLTGLDVETITVRVKKAYESCRASRSNRGSGQQ